MGEELPTLSPPTELEVDTGRASDDQSLAPPALTPVGSRPSSAASLPSASGLGSSVASAKGRRRNEMKAGRSTRSLGSSLGKKSGESAASGAAAQTTSNDPLQAQKALQAATKQWDKERNALQVEVAGHQTTIRKLERELANLTAQVGTLELSLQQEESDRQVDREEHSRLVNKEQERIRNIQAKLEKVPTLEQNIVDMYMEFMEMTNQEGGVRSTQTPEEIQQQLNTERQALVCQSPLVTLDKLRVQLRKLLSQFDRRALALKNQLEDSLSDKNSAQEVVQACQLELDELKQAHSTEVQHLEQEIERCNTKSREAAINWERVQADLKGQIHQLNDVVLRQHVREIDHLKDLLVERDQILLSRERRNVDMSMLESQLSRDRERHKRESNALRAQTEKQKAQLHKEAVLFKDTFQKNTELEKEKRRLKEELHEARIAVNRSRVVEVQDKCTKAAARSNKLQKEVKELKDSHERLEKQLEEYKAKNARMREQYTNLFTAVQRDHDAANEREKRSLDKEKGRASSPAAGRGLEEQSLLKQKLEAKERECGELHRRLKKHMLQQHRDKQYHELEKGLLEDELKEVQTLTEAAPQTPPPKSQGGAERKGVVMAASPAARGERASLGRKPKARPQSAAI